MQSNLTHHIYLFFISTFLTNQWSKYREGTLRAIKQNNNSYSFNSALLKTESLLTAASKEHHVLKTLLVDSEGAVTRAYWCDLNWHHCVCCFSWCCFCRPHIRHSGRVPIFAAVQVHVCRLGQICRHTCLTSSTSEVLLYVTRPCEFYMWASHTHSHTHRD